MLRGFYFIGRQKMFTENELFIRLTALRGYEVINAETGLVRAGSTWIKVYRCGNHKLDMAYFYKAYEQMESQVSHLIFLFTHATIQIKKLKIYKDVLRIEFFSVPELCRLLIGNRLIPPHRRIPDPEATQILKRFGKENMPHLLQTDPMARLYDFPLDAVIEIERADVLYYRLVVADE